MRMAAASERQKECAVAKLIHAGEFATEGERLAASELQKLPAHWVVICNKTLPLHNGGSFELDFIIIADNWVFLLDEKSWRGTIRGNDQFWVRSDGTSAHSPLNKVDYVAKVLAGHIRTKVPSLAADRSLFVHGAVLLSAAQHAPVLRDEPRAHGGIFLLASVVKKLLQADQQGGTPVVAQHREQIRACLFDLSDRPKIPHQIDLFTVQELVAEKLGARIFDARASNGEGRTLMVYELGTSAFEAQERRDFYLREYDVLTALHDSGLVPDVKDPFIWSDDFLVVPISPLPGKSLAALPLPETHDELATELAIMETAFRGLAQIHEAGIVHRALGPDALYIVSGGQQPKVAFTNFYAARLGTHSIAVTLDAFAIQDPYAASELVHGYGLATAASDTFSLALTFLERISRLKLVELRPKPDGPVVVPELADTWANVALRDDMAELTALFKEVLNPHGKALTAADIVEFIGDLAKRIRVSAVVEERRILDNRYRVERVLGEGAMARTYLVTDTLTGDLFAVKQLLLPSQNYDDAKKEWNALKDITSQYLPRVYDIYPPQNDVHVKMEYIPGPTLHDVMNEFPWPLDRWWTFARHLLEAVAILEDKGLLHRDIKPANIILQDRTGEPVIIDFGFAVRRDRPAPVAGSLLFQPREALTAELPPPTSDLYAVATVLYHMLSGRLPSAAEESAEEDLAELDPSVPEAATLKRLASVLRLARSSDPAERPASSRELLRQLEEAFRAPVVALPTTSAETSLMPLTNPWVARVRGLFRNSVAGNADNRGLDSEFVRETYVPTSLDEELLPAIITRRPHAVFLSGNPGDGKTAFLEQVRQWLEHHGGTCISQDASGWEWSYESHTFRACYDASEAHAGMSADEQLAAKLAELEGSTLPTAAVTVLVAINDGRLADFFPRHAGRFSWLGKQLRTSERHTNLAEAGVWVVDLKRRAFARLPGDAAPSIAARVLDRLLLPEQWSICDGCAAKDLCPIRANALALRQPNVSERLQRLLLLTHLRRQYHTTMRDLRSTFAYLITGNLDCSDVHAALADGTHSATLVDHTYWRTAFAPLTPVEELLSDLAQLDPGRRPQPRLDRFLHFHQSPRDATVRSTLFYDGRDLAPQRFASEREWLAAVKRRLYFERADAAATQDQPAVVLPPADALLPYRHAETFLNALRGQANLRELKRRLALGILRSDGVNFSPQANVLGIKVSASDEQQLVILKQFPLERISLDVPQPTDRVGSVETIPEVLRLRFGTSHQLAITLDLFELLMRFADGLQPTAPEFQPLLEDLVPFKSALLLSESRELVLVESGRHVHYITQAGGKIVRHSSDRS
jgi:serine/threonine protein kinase